MKGWLGGRCSASATERVRRPGGGAMLMVFVCPALAGEAYWEEGGNGDEDLIDRWMPQFHR